MGYEVTVNPHSCASKSERISRIKSSTRLPECGGVSNRRSHALQNATTGCPFSSLEKLRYLLESAIRYGGQATCARVALGIQKNT
jgi:hypothetical protein